MILFHGTTAEICERFRTLGIDGNVLHKRIIHGPQDNVPGLFVTPELEVAKRFGSRVVAIEVEPDEIVCPPLLEQCGISLGESLKNSLESQALLNVYVPPERVMLVYSDNARMSGSKS